MSTLLLPAHPPRSRTARLLGWLALPCLGVALFLDSLLTAAGLPPADRPLPLRLFLVLIIVVPGVAWSLAPFVARLPGLGWLADRRPLILELDESKVTIRHGGSVQTIRWIDIVGLRVFEGSPPSASFVLRDRSRVRVPGELVIGRGADGTRTTLLDAIDRVRPDLAQRDARRRHARSISYAVISLVVAAGLLGLLVLMTR